MSLDKSLFNNREVFVTISDGAFLPQVLCLYNSLVTHIFNPSLIVICVDQDAGKFLNALGLDRVYCVSWCEFDDDRLAAVFDVRSRAEFCWTLTPYAIRFCLNALKLQKVTYLDADVWALRAFRDVIQCFEKSPQDIFVTTHSYAPDDDRSLVAGKFCVQFVSVKRSGLEIIESWMEECIENCSSVPSLGRFGDQKYLDAWPDRYGSRLFIGSPQLFLAPWNFWRFPHSESCFFHFHGLRLLKGKKVFVGTAEIPKRVFRDVYTPYAEELKSSIVILESVGWTFQSQSNRSLFWLIGLAYRKRLRALLWKICPQWVID